MKPLRGGIVVAVRVPVRSHNAVYMSTAATCSEAAAREVGDLRPYQKSWWGHARYKKRQQPCGS